MDWTTSTGVQNYANLHYVKYFPYRKMFPIEAIDLEILFQNVDKFLSG
jgi:hypothetical protein